MARSRKTTPAARRRAPAGLRGILRDVVEDSADAFLLKDVSGRYLDLNAAGASFLGRSRRDVLGKTDAQLFPPLLAGKIVEEDRRVLRTGVAETFEQVMESHGRARTYLVTKRAYRAPAGRAAGLIAIARDVTSHRQMEEALKASERRFHDFMDKSPTTVFMKDAQGRYAYLNHTLLRLFGIRAADWLGKTDAELWPEAVANHIRANDARVLSSGQALTAVESVPARDGSSSHWLVVKFPFVDARGQAYLAGLGLNVTDQKKAEDEVQRGEQQLWELLGERERLSQDLHDNIIQKIYAVGLELEHYKHHVTGGGPPGFPSKPLEHAVAELNAVIRDVRSYIKGIDPGLTQAVHFRTELTRLVERPGERPFPQFRITLDPLAASSLSLDQAKHVLFIVQEAVSNSCRHSEAKRGSVSLRRAGDGLLLEVEDDGVGFDAEAAERSGNGLRNIAARARKLGGSLKIISQRGQGMRILVGLPQAGLHD